MSVQGSFSACKTCVNRCEDAWVCDDCHDGAGYVFDESLIQLTPDGFFAIVTDEQK